MVISSSCCRHIGSEALVDARRHSTGYVQLLGHKAHQAAGGGHDQRGGRGDRKSHSRTAAADERLGDAPLAM